MVKLTKIYTRTGDDGTTGIVGTERVSKAAPLMAAIGAVDEANCAIGLARAALDGAPSDILKRVQNDLFDLGADLATPAETEGALRVTPDQTRWLETQIDAVNADLEPLSSFILPGGTEAAARLHMARALARRAERAVIAARESGADSGAGGGPEPAIYLNRLSDLLFVMARAANDGGAADLLWVPGGER